MIFWWKIVFCSKRSVRDWGPEVCKTRRIENLFLFLLWLRWLRFPELGGIKVVNVHPHFVLNLRGDASRFSPISMMVVGLWYMAFIIFRLLSFMLTFWRIFIINEHWILSKDFICIYWDDHNDFYVSKFQDTKLTHGNLFHFYTLTMNEQKRKLREKNLYHIKKKKKARNKLA